MSQQLRFVGIEGDMCGCGRRRSIRHCNACGSARIYAYAHPEYYTNLAGEVELVSQLFRCLGCGHRFIDVERQFCEAPPFGIEDAKRKVRVLAEAAQRGEHLRPEEAQASKIITELLEQQPKVATPNNEEQVVESLVEELESKNVANADTKETPVSSINSLRPEGLTDIEWQETRNALIAQWADAKARLGILITPTVEEYVKRTLNGEKLI